MKYEVGMKLKMTLAIDNIHMAAFLKPGMIVKIIEVPQEAQLYMVSIEGTGVVAIITEQKILDTHFAPVVDATDFRKKVYDALGLFIEVSEDAAIKMIQQARTEAQIRVDLAKALHYNTATPATSLLNEVVLNRIRSEQLRAIEKLVVGTQKV